ncbi:hypothetical protein [Alteromonas sp. M12]|uniref:hypothetical protein n=1 Tax=Alteromonas sp. M12 TaxID=3135644 RepID=UPI00319E19D8
MKKLTLFSVIIVAILSSAVVIGQTEPVPETKPDPVIHLLKNFEQRLQRVDKTKQDRSSRLRLQRAEYYYYSSKRFHQSNWQAQALDHAQRGLRLLDLREGNIQTSSTGSALLSSESFTPQ